MKEWKLNLLEQIRRVDELSHRPQEIGMYS